MAEKAVTPDYLKSLGMREASGTGANRIEWLLGEAKELKDAKAIDSAVNIGGAQIRLPKGTEIKVIRCIMLPTMVRGTRYETTYLECEVSGKRRMIKTSDLLQPVQVPRDAVEGQEDQLDALAKIVKKNEFIDPTSQSPSKIIADITGKTVEIIDEIIIDRLVTPNPEKGFNGKLKTVYRPFKKAA